MENVDDNLGSWPNSGYCKHLVGLARVVGVWMLMSWMKTNIANHPYTHLMATPMPTPRQNHPTHQCPLTKQHWSCASLAFVRLYP